MQTEKKLEFDIPENVRISSGFGRSCCSLQIRANNNYQNKKKVRFSAKKESLFSFRAFDYFRLAGQKLKNACSCCFGLWRVLEVVVLCVHSWTTTTN